MARIVIDKATLKRHRACDDAYTSPEWDEKAQAIVFNDWSKTVERLLAKGPKGVDQLEWWVSHKLVPMTMDEFIVIKKAQADKPQAASNAASLSMLGLKLKAGPK